MLAKPIVCVFFSILGYCPYLSGTTISLLVRLTLHFSFWRSRIFFFGCVSLSGDMSCVGVDRSRPITIFCCSVRPMFSVMCGLSCSLFMVVGCSHFYVVFVFYSRHLYFYLFYLISKGIFHIGGLVSKMHISVYVLFTEWKCFCFLFFLHLLSTILGL